MKIDFHTHADTADPAAVKTFVGRCERLETRACVCGFGPRADHPSCTNEETLAVCREYSKVLIPVAWVDLWDRVEAGCVARFAEQGFKALKCIAPYYAYDHDLYMPIYEKAETLGLPVLFHTGLYRPNATDIRDRRPMLQNMRPVTIDRIARSFPKLNIVMAHMGSGIFRHEAAEMIKGYPNVYADLAGSGSWKALEAADLAELLAHRVFRFDASFSGFQKLILGSDAYLSMPDLLEEAQGWYLRTLERVGVPGEILERIMGQTATGWFK